MISFGDQSLTESATKARRDEIKGTIYEVRRLRGIKKRPVFNQGKAECPVKRGSRSRRRERGIERRGREEDGNGRGTKELTEPMRHWIKIVTKLFIR